MLTYFATSTLSLSPRTGIISCVLAGMKHHPNEEQQPHADSNTISRYHTCPTKMDFPIAFILDWQSHGNQMPEQAQNATFFQLLSRTPNLLTPPAPGPSPSPCCTRIPRAQKQALTAERGSLQSQLVASPGPERALFSTHQHRTLRRSHARHSVHGHAAHMHAALSPQPRDGCKGNRTPHLALCGSHMITPTWSHYVSALPRSRTRQPGATR